MDSIFAHSVNFLEHQERIQYQYSFFYVFRKINLSFLEISRINMYTFRISFFGQKIRTFSIIFLGQRFWGHFLY